MGKLLEDRLFEWWMMHRFDRFCEYMHAWTRDVGEYTSSSKEGEDHSDEDVRINRAISYIDMDDRHKNGGGFIKQYLLIKYGMEFVNHITASYWEIEISQS